MALSLCLRPIYYDVLFRDEIRHSAAVYEVRLVFRRCLPFRRLASLQQSFHAVEPEFRHAVVVGLVLISGNCAPMALNQLAESGDSSTNRAVNVLQIVKEFVVSHARPLGDAINDLYHAVDTSLMELQNTIAESD